MILLASIHTHNVEYIDIEMIIEVIYVAALIT